MRIIEANIIQFGKFKDRTFTFDDGFNIVKGDNESGKSTLLGFIKFALYGVGRKNPTVAVGERERALSWNIGIAAGSLTVEDNDGKKYRIERAGREGARGAYVDKTRIIDLESGEEVFSGEVPGEHFLGINAQGYDSMCNIKQLETVAVGADAVKGVIDNLLSSGDETMDVQTALKSLDAERRRLMHSNGKGGLVYESGLTLDRLKNDYKTAISYENERMKNTDELSRVEITLAKVREEHGLAQRMCDLHDDVLRIEKFDRLRSLKKEEDELVGEINALENSVNFDISNANYEKIAQINSICDALSRSEVSFENAEKELKNAENELNELGSTNSKGFANIIEEFGSPRGAVTHLSVKKKKKNSSALTLTIFGIGGTVMLVLAAILALAMNNVSGAMTVAFIGALLCVIAFIFVSKFKSAKKEISTFMSQLGGDFCPKDEKKILDALRNFSETREKRIKYSTALESAKFRFDASQENLKRDRETLAQCANNLGIKSPDGINKEAILAICEQMKAYLEAHGKLDASLREKRMQISMLQGELERFSEKNLRARITPEIIEKIKEIPFEKLKSERDAALQRANQWSQYKAGIERNLALYGTRRSANEIFPEIEAEQENYTSLKLRLDAVRLAMETLNSASMNIKSDITPRIRENAQKNLALVTNGKYNELFIDQNMSLSVFADGATRPIDSLSKGSLDAAYFSVRLALLQTLLNDKKPPLYMDETLSQLDDGRAENTLKAINKHASTSQCILFTCQGRDVEIAKSLGDVNVIQL